MAITFIALMICLVLGGGIYYFIDQNQTVSPIDAAIISSDVTPPQIENISRTGITETGATITWKTDKPATSRIVVRDSSGDIIVEKEVEENLATSHSVSLNQLEPGITYKYTVISTDDAGNETTSKGELTTTARTDEVPPDISGISVSNITETEATITWITDERATSQVKYGKTETYGAETTESLNLSTSHSVKLTGLENGKTYNFQAISKDSGGNTATSPNQTFETPAGISVGCDVGERAPDFTLQNLDGEEVFIQLSDYRGKMVMLNFWAVWCAPCLEEMPNIQVISDNWSDTDLVILTIASNYGENIDDVNEYIDDGGYTFPVYFDSEGQAKSLYSISVWPTTYFIDTEGIIWHIKFERFEDQAEIEDILNSL